MRDCLCLCWVGPTALIMCALFQPRQLRSCCCNWEEGVPRIYVFGREGKGVTSCRARGLLPPPLGVPPAWAQGVATGGLLRSLYGVRKLVRRRPQRVKVFSVTVVFEPCRLAGWLGRGGCHMARRGGAVCCGLAHTWGVDGWVGGWVPGAHRRRCALARVLVDKRSRHNSKSHWLLALLRRFLEI